MNRCLCKLVYQALEVPSRRPQILSCSSTLLLNYQQERNAGHSKWQNIRHTKEANDAKKGDTANKYSHLVRKLVLEGGPDPKLNGKLADLIATASKLGVSKATIERAIKRAIDTKVEKVIIEVLAPGGAFLLAEAETDTPVDLKYQVKVALRKYKKDGAAILRKGVAEHSFAQRGVVKISRKTKDGQDIGLERAEEIAIEAGAEEVKESDNEDEAHVWLLETDPNDMFAVKGKIEKSFSDVEIIEYDSIYIAHQTVPLTDEQLEKTSELCDALNEVQDIQRVYDNIQ
ncbi:Translational activator of cytochrome c oxidase 1 [Halotydeus destructor]|nr:Translational activator of cytochrome c oxidase 1 [Halotydeus destructor]